jgi:hypothetical protein
MIVRFSTRHGQLTMHGEPARRLLVLGGHSGTVPGAVLAAELPAFLARLREGLARHGDEISPPPSPVRDDPSERDDDDAPRERGISLHTRALPVIDMVETALARGSDLMWDRA